MNSISQPFPHTMPEHVGAAFDMAVSEAWRFAGQTAPNPAVGCVLLDARGEVLVIAAHHKAGALHAERLAVEQAHALGVVERIHTAVVTLEPCNHTGRTPPCTEALLSTPVQTVWIGCADPNPHVPGGGAAYLQARGLDVRWLAHAANGGACLARCKALLAPFAWRMAHGRPWITVKQAVNAQGNMVPPVGSTTFTTRQSLEFAHILRRVTDGIVTGTGTIQADLPAFTVRHVPDHANRRRVLVVCGAPNKVPAHWQEQAQARFDVLFCPDCADLPAVLASTSALWVMVEAGPTLLRAISAQGLWDDWLHIRQDAQGCDHFSVSTRHDISPLSLFPQWARCTQEQACFPVL
ncbi:MULTISPECIES: bifunctional diaminohydroxyphosphoribosylaminopyrimidine deaminase/5-amino-6-(5-phosphoribosylamino)uracil reductase RibD [Acetobacter]|uniref:Riboflavin biosynthesis protein RibD n=1 Tax=Acetobacter lovaniensis TaxID=104100 RepID=A0A841QEU0_9PROT|nr:diaminohydroxyphosphoribosylaminopyrimidine deaminase/5-amino-6-(5-phosphoribosylamino)uracil reductase [Acetobacter lovaniensis]GBQ62586.1 riboflavin biosynthesis protein RibD [Acetobacter lovaniensis NRIC 0474]